MDCKITVYIVLVILDVLALLVYKMSAPGAEMIDFISGKIKSVSTFSIVWSVMLLLFIVVPYFFAAAFCGSAAGSVVKRLSK